MKKVVISSVLALLLIVSTVSSLESGTIFSTEPGEGYKCVYVSLPQDLGLSYLEDTYQAVIEVDKGDSPWADMTYSEVVMEPGVLNKNPVCFFYSNKEEGEFSFYRITLSSKDLDVSSSISGGLCVSDYEDVDTGVDAEEGTDICGLLNENSDIIDLSFKEDVTQANPGELVTKTLYVTSYANLRIKLAIATNLDNDFGESVVSTSHSNPTAVKTFKVKAPQTEGDFEILLLAEAEGCSIQACKKYAKTVLSVTTEGKDGFSASVIPKNINLKDPVETTFRVVISNYDETQDFSIETNSDPELTISPESKEVRVGKNDEKTTTFKATPGEDDLYKIEFKIITEKSEELLTAYISIGELLTDALRTADYAEEEIPDMRQEILKAKEDYENRYSESSYEENIDDYEDFLGTIDDIKQTSTNITVNGNGGKKEDGGFAWIFFVIPVIIIVVVVLLFIAYRKAKITESEGYSGFSRY